ncbi:Pentatricopeptide repeat-containing protein [Camellia lanceoleosa]|uniref:Pentatricopeptide repeat-containing protein n=1 Tax=Camellia lanceoleosa TaxID=1840588 RepID=A0ACC0IAJ0_9ERIC|nr:Pentatricopeptide repeat-containing protein [Camellia lanceoleosa]
MSATVRRVRKTLKVCSSSPFVPSSSTSHSSQTLISSTLTLSPKTLNSQLSQCCSTSSSSSVDRNFDFLQQFSPFPLSNSSNSSITVINSNERRRIVVGLAKLIKKQQGYLLKGFSRNFCPYFLVNIMKLFENRQIAFAFFKFSFGDDSEETLRSSCLVAHLLAAGGLRFLAQDLLSWVVARIGFYRSCEVVEFMCREHHKYESDFSVLDSLMRAFLNAEMGSRALEIVDRMREVGARPSLSAVNILFKLLLRTGDYGSVWKLFRDMVRKGPCPMNYTFNVIILGLLKDLTMSGLLPDRSLSDISVAGLCWAGRLDEAMGILEDMLEKGIAISVASFNSVIAAYSHAGLEDRAFEAYKIMVKFGLSPSSSTCSSLLMALSKKGRLQEARELMNVMMEKGYPVNEVAFTVILDGYFRAGGVQAAQSLWEEMESRGMSPDAVAFSALIDGLSKAGLVEEAYNVFLEMLERGFVPNNYAYNSLIGGFCNCGRLSEALKLEKEMKQRGLLPDIFTINMIINGFCKQGRMKSAIDTFMDMHRIGLTPDVVTFNTLISGYCKAFDMANADAFLNKMYASGWDPDITTYNIRIHGFCSSRRMNRAVMMLDELVLSGAVPNTVTYNTMMNGVCNDILERAMILTAKLLKMAFVPNIVTTNLLLSHLCKQGLPERTLMWGQKLSEFCFDFDEITYKILDRAYRNIQEDAEYFRETSGKSLFLDFLMYITYDYLRRYGPRSETRQYSFQLIDSGSSGSCNVTKKGSL